MRAGRWIGVPIRGPWKAEVKARRVEGRLVPTDLRIKLKDGAALPRFGLNHSDLKSVDIYAIHPRGMTPDKVSDWMLGVGRVGAWES